jgi:hypothetical protein
MRKTRPMVAQPQLDQSFPVRHHRGVVVWRIGIVWPSGRRCPKRTRWRVACCKCRTCRESATVQRSKGPPGPSGWDRLDRFASAAAPLLRIISVPPCKTIGPSDVISMPAASLNRRSIDALSPVPILGRKLVGQRPVVMDVQVVDALRWDWLRRRTCSRSLASRFRVGWAGITARVTAIGRLILRVGRRVL